MCIYNGPQVWSWYIKGTMENENVRLNEQHDYFVKDAGLSYIFPVVLSPKSSWLVVMCLAFKKL